MWTADVDKLISLWIIPIQPVIATKEATEIAAFLH